MGEVIRSLLDTVSSRCLRDPKVEKEQLTLHCSCSKYVSNFIANIYGRLLSCIKKEADNDSLLGTYLRPGFGKA